MSPFWATRPKRPYRRGVSECPFCKSRNTDIKKVFMDEIGGLDLVIECEAGHRWWDDYERKSKTPDETKRDIKSLS